MVSVGAPRERELSGRKKKVETIMLDILQLLELDSESPENFRINVQVLTGKEEKSSPELVIQLPVNYGDDPQILLDFKEKVDHFRKIKKRKQEEFDREFGRELKGVIEKNFSDPDFNVEQLARKLYISQATLYRKVKCLFGTSPCDLLRTFRLNRAVKLLGSHFGSVLDVALEVGFNSRIYFTNCFKERFHKTPSQFLEEERTDWDK